MPKHLFKATVKSFMLLIKLCKIKQNFKEIKENRSVDHVTNYIP